LSGTSRTIFIGGARWAKTALSGICASIQKAIRTERLLRLSRRRSINNSTGASRITRNSIHSASDQGSAAEPIRINSTTTSAITPWLSSIGWQFRRHCLEPERVGRTIASSKNGQPSNVLHPPEICHLVPHGTTKAGLQQCGFDDGGFQAGADRSTLGMLGA